MFTTIKNHTKGFTLIELLVVIAIIGILSSVVLASLGTAREKARDATRISDIKNLQTAIALYYDSAQSYPENQTGVANANQLAGVNFIGTALSPTYIPNLPIDPSDVSRAAPLKYLYEGLLGLTTDCSVALTCTSYTFGATMERTDNVVLDTDSGDAVITTAVRGLGIVSCDGGAVAGTSGVDEACYNIVP